MRKALISALPVTQAKDHIQNKVTRDWEASQSENEEVQVHSSQSCRSHL